MNSFIDHLAGLDLLAEAPHIGAGAERPAAIVAVQHRPAGNGDRRQIAARRAHDQGRRRLVAAAQQDHAVDRVAANRLLDVHRREVAEQHRRRPQAGLTQRGDRELERDPAALPHAALDVLGHFTEVEVARRQLRPRVADADDRAAVEDAFGQAAADPAAVDEAVLVDLSEPRCRPVLALRICHLVLSFPASVCAPDLKVGPTTFRPGPSARPEVCAPDLKVGPTTLRTGTGTRRPDLQVGRPSGR